VGAILSHPGNIESIGYLKALKYRCASNGVDVTFSYMVGNHGWPINRFSSTRQAIARFVSLSDVSSYGEARFLEYRVLRRTNVNLSVGMLIPSFSSTSKVNAIKTDATRPGQARWVMEEA
jgi:hypothetical protein